MSEQDMDNINSGDESDHDHISKEMLEDIRDGSQTQPNVTRREARYKICDHDLTHHRVRTQYKEDNIFIRRCI